MLDIMAITAQPNDGQTRAKKTASVPIGLLESRGSKMLKAALSNKSISKDKPFESQPVHHINIYKTQQGSRNRKSPKNNVLFRDPVVSQEHSYEQTYFDDDIESSSGSDQSINEQKTSTNECLPITNKLNKTPPREFGEDDDDDDDDLFIMASDDLEIVTNPTPSSGSKKRLHASDEGERKPVNRSQSSAGGLFSSPKVAKIAPYFDDERLDGRRSLLNRNRLRAIQRRSLPARRYTIKRSDSVFAQCSRPFESTDDRVSDLTLSSYKKFSSPQVSMKSEPRNLSQADETNCKSAANGYIGWFATFITNQMNKLIF